MQVTIKKWGNSSSIRLPVSVMKRISLHPDNIVEITVENDRIVITRIKKVKYQYNLDELQPGYI